MAASSLILSSFFFLLLSSAFGLNVTYDHRSLIIDGQRKLLISGSIHYPRSVPAVNHQSRRLISFMRHISLSLSELLCFILISDFLPSFFNQMWPELIAKAKDGGCDTIETYVFWNGHELSPGNVIDIAVFFFFLVSDSTIFPIVFYFKDNFPN